MSEPEEDRYHRDCPSCNQAMSLRDGCEWDDDPALNICDDCAHKQLATLRLKLAGLQAEVRTVMSINSDETAMPGCECQRCRIIRALDGAAAVEGRTL
jgi:hypothetical protein